MTIEQLQCFMAIIRYNSFSLAAEESYISQSSLSKKIKALEVEMGVEFFNRKSKKLEITDAGKAFYKSAKIILDEYQNTLNTMHKYAKEYTEVLNIGTIPVMNHYGLTDIFFKFQEYYTNIRLHLIEANSVPIIESFTKGKLDIAFLRSNYMPEGDYKVYPLVDDELVLVANSSHWLAEFDHIHLSRANHEKFLFLSSNTGMYESCHKTCLEAGFAPLEQKLDVRSNTIKNLVANGQGVSLMMYQSIKYMNDTRVKIIRLENPTIINLSLIVRNEAMTDAVSAFVEFVLDSFGKM